MLVTGGAGFIGSAIAAELLARGRSVTILDDFSTGYERNVASLDGDIDVVHGDVCDPRVVERACADAEAIFHQAAVASVKHSVDDPLRCGDVNVHGTLRLLETARRRGIERVVLAASAAAYGDSEELPKREDMRPEPTSPYAVSKVAGEHYLSVYARLFGMKTLSLRYFNVFGPRQDPNSEYAAVVPKFVEAVCGQREPVIYGDGEQTRDFCYIDNVVDANMRALELEAPQGEVVNIAGGDGTSIRELLTRLRALANTNAEPRYEAPRPGDIRHSRADISRAERLLGYRPEVSVDEGLRRTLQWARS